MTAEQGTFSGAGHSVSGCEPFRFSDDGASSPVYWHPPEGASGVFRIEAAHAASKQTVRAAPSTPLP